MIPMTSDTILFGKRSTDRDIFQTVPELIGGWLALQSTVFAEAMLAIYSLLQAYKCVSLAPDGKPLAPFVYSALKWLSLTPHQWSLALLIYGFLAIIALIHGQTTGNAYGLRAFVQACGAVLYAVVFLAILFSPTVKVAGLDYGFWSFCSAITALTLWLRLEYKKKEERLCAQRESERHGT